MKIRELIIKTTELLKKSGIESASIDCRLLLCKYLGVDKVYLIVNSEKDVDVSEEFDALVMRRANHEPMQYILGKAEFMGLDFKVSPDVLIPRADTEVLVEKVIEHIGEDKSVLLDIGTGSGCIPISILKKCKGCTAYSADISENALKVAKENAISNGVDGRLTLINADILKDFPQIRVDCIVSNPPYIEEDVIPNLMSDVKDFEPYIALSGGKDGLVFYRQIAVEGYKILNDNGFIAFEIGYNQADDVSKILDHSGFTEIKVTKDLAGNDRVVTAKKKGK